jgi:hypothetical protein
VEAVGVSLAWFPSYLLICATLERLCLLVKISEGLKIHLSMVNLPFLKTLSLLEVVIHEEMINGLVSACPLLEQLTLIGCSFEIPEIALLKLKDLTVSDSYSKPLRIFAPDLVYLYCEAQVEMVSFESMSCLYEAQITFLRGRLGGQYDKKVVAGLHNLANVRKLHLYGSDVMVTLHGCTLKNLYLMTI